MPIKNIETGVDRLVSLIAKKKEIDLADASKELGISEPVVREWVEFLEEEGLISVDYGISKVILSDKKITKKDAEKKVQEYSSKKDAFVRNVETTLKSLQRETEEFEIIKTEFEGLKTKIGSEMEGVKRELDELRHYEDLKQNIDNDIQKQKREYLDLIDNARSEIKFEHDKYSSLLKDIGVEKDSLIKDKKEILQLEEKEDHLRKRLEAIYGIIKNIESQIGDKRHDIGDAEVHITKLISLAESVEKAIREKKEDVITPLIKKSEEQADKISIVQDSILLKIKNKEMRINSFSEESKKLSEKFTKFFDKKMRIEQLLKKIDDDKHSMESQLRILIKTAQAFDIIAKKTDAKKYMDELVKTYDQIDEKRNLLKKKITQLSSIVREN